LGAGPTPGRRLHAEDYSGLEALASYWHATDIIWLVIFPFFYVLA
jgi:cytochrome c oxidase subunit 3